MSIAFACVCGTPLAAADRCAGLHALCPACGAHVPVPVPDADAAQGETSDIRRCAACGNTVTPETCVGCRRCRALYHAVCLRDSRACALAGCPNAETGRAIRIGETTRAGERRCPRCADRIPERAARCRHCGAVVDGTEGLSARRGPGCFRIVRLVLGGLVCLFSAATMGTGIGWGRMTILALILAGGGYEIFEAHRGERGWLSRATLGLWAVAGLLWVVGL